MGFERVAKKLVAALNENGVECYIWHVAKTGSVYIRFKDNRIGSVRFGDHEGRTKLKYKYNVRSDRGDAHFGKWERDGDQWRFYISVANYKGIVPVLIDRAEQVKKWQKSKFTYTIPKFKQK